MDNDSNWKRIVPKTIPSCLLNDRNKLIIPNKALSNADLVEYAYCLKIPHFRGVYMIDNLPKAPWKNEAAIINLDKTTGLGTHWVCYKIINNIVYYFDSFGNLPPPHELQVYFKKASKVFYNVNRVQEWNTDVCGHLCLEFLADDISSL